VRADNPLHLARLDRGLELAQLADHTALSPWIVQKIDAGHFDQLPPGIYARAYVRTFASAVGLEPEQAVRDVLDRLPSVEDPLPVMRGIANRGTPAWIGTMSTWLNGVLDRAVQSMAKPAPGQERTWRGARTIGAAAVDAGVLLMAYGALLVLTSWTSGVTVERVAAHATAGLMAVWVVVACLYFLLLGGIGGATPGARMLRLPRPPLTNPMRLHAIVYRAFRYPRQARPVR